jgi:hypothetical protein
MRSIGVLWTEQRSDTVRLRKIGEAPGITKADRVHRTAV